MVFRKLPRDLLLLTLTMIVANTAGFMYMPLLPLYLASLGASVEQIGLFFTLQVILSIAFRILGGWISDHIGRLQTIAIGGVFSLGASLGFALAPTWGWAILGALFAEIGSALVGPSFQAYTAEKAPEGSTSSTFGWVNGLFFVCVIIGPLLGGFLAENYGYRPLLGVATSIFAVATVIRLLMARGSSWAITTLKPAALVRDARGLLALLLSGGLLLWLFITDGLADAGMQLAMPFLPKFVTEVGGISASAYTALFAWTSVVTSLTMWPCGRFADRYGERRSIAIGALLFGFIWWGTVFKPTPPVFAVVFTLAGVAQGFIMPAFSSLISKSVPRESLGMTWGVYMTALGVLAIPAPYIGGLLYDNVAPSAAFVVAGVCMMVAAPLALWKLRLPTPLPQVEPVLKRVEG